MSQRLVWPCPSPPRNGEPIRVQCEARPALHRCPIFRSRSPTGPTGLPTAYALAETEPRCRARCGQATDEAEEALDPALMQSSREVLRALDFETACGRIRRAKYPRIEEACDGARSHIPASGTSREARRR